MHPLGSLSFSGPLAPARVADHPVLMARQDSAAGTAADHCLWFAALVAGSADIRRFGLKP